MTIETKASHTQVIKTFLVLVYITAILAASLLLVSCGSFDISLEGNPEGPLPIATEEVEDPVLELEPSVEDDQGQDGQGPFYIGEPFSVGTSDEITVLQVREGVAGFTQSPVEMGVLWDYSGPSGKIAYASEFYHASRAFSRSVTDLWIYDYATDTTEQWLQDDVGRAYWSPYIPDSLEPQQLVAAIFDSDIGAFDLVLVDGPDQTRKIAECSSEEFSFSPDGSRIAYKSGWYNESQPRPDECSGVFIIELEDGSIRRLTNTDPLATGGWYRDQPLWGESLDALLFKSFNEDSIFNIVPLGGTEWSQVGIAESIQEDYLPTPFFSIWSDAHRSVIGQTEGMMDPHAVWVYRLSADGAQIEDAFRVDWGEFRHDLLLLGWWEPGESVLIRDISNPSDLNPLGEVVVWSLSERRVMKTVSIKPDIPITVYPEDISTGIAELDVVLAAFLSGSAEDRARLAQTVIEGCTTDSFAYGPPPCEVGMAEGTLVERFPYMQYREERYETPENITTLMDFEVAGLYAIYRILSSPLDSGFASDHEYVTALVSAEGHKLVLVSSVLGRVQRIDFWELTPPETLDRASVEYLLPPLD